jgi:tetratricopeptide (TPR) repeat protein
MNNFQRLLTVLCLVSGLNVPATAAVSASQAATGAGAIAQETQSSATDELVQAAIGLYRQQKFDEALANCAKASRLSPKDHRPHVLAGYVYMAEMKYRSASEAFGIAIRLQPQNKELYLLKARVDLERHARDEALAACRKALAIDPQYAEAFAMIGEILGGDEKRRAEAISAYQSAIKANPRFLAAYEPLGRLFEEAKDQKRAEEVFRQGLAADPNRMACRFELGRMLVEQGRLAEARGIWEGRTSDEDRTLPQFIVLLKRAENLKRATDALAQKPTDPDALIEMGLAVMDGDSWVIDERQKRAIVYFKQALKLRPGYARAQYGICKAHIQLADTFKHEKKVVDQELAKLRRLDAALADELEEYRKNYVGGFIAGPQVNVDK